MSIKLIAYFYVHQQKTFAYLLGFNRLIPIWKKKKKALNIEYKNICLMLYYLLPIIQFFKFNIIAWKNYIINIEIIDKHTSKIPSWNINAYLYVLTLVFEL